MLKGRIVSFNGDRLMIEAKYGDVQTLVKKGFTDCRVILNDGRKISVDQRKKIYATLNDISAWTGYMPEQMKQIMKYLFIANTGAEYFSFSDVDMTTAKNFLEFLIEFCLYHNIPTRDSLIDRCPEIERYIYMCLKHRKCCITGRKAELHHVDAVGMGRDRNEITHLGMRALPLTRKLHTEAHTIGQQAFDEKYHVKGFAVTEELCRIWHIKY